MNPTASRFRRGVWSSVDAKTGREAGMIEFKAIWFDRERIQENTFCVNGGRLRDDGEGCVCSEGFYGLRCEFEEPCTTIALDATQGPFQGRRPLPQTYELVQNVSLYHKPVYLGESTLVFFAGRRWVAAPVSLEKISNNELGLIQSLETSWDDISVEFVSEPIDIETPKDGVTPLGVTWFVSSDPSSPIPVADRARTSNAKFVCAVCNDLDNPCLNFGVCQNSTCSCLPGGKGTLCEDAPTGDGFCHEELNVFEYDFDGGDCCEATCESTSDFLCGDQSDFRYQTCRDLSILCDDDGPCWRPFGDKLYRESVLQDVEAGLSFSVDGRVLVVGDTYLLRVDAFSKNGKGWSQEGESILGPIGTQFAETCAVSRFTHRHEFGYAATYNVAVSQNEGVSLFGIVRLPAHTMPVDNFIFLTFSFCHVQPNRTMQDHIWT